MAEYHSGYMTAHEARTVCAGCGKSLNDKKFLVPGFGGIMRHECGDTHEHSREGGMKGHITRREQGLESIAGYGARLEIGTIPDDEHIQEDE